MSALECNGSRILTPAEAEAIRSVIEKPRLLYLFDLLLYSGMRLSEVRQLMDDPSIFDETRMTVSIVSTKVKAKQKKRTIDLSDKGVEAVKAYLNQKDPAPSVPSSPHVWQMNLIRWATRARLAPIAGQAAIAPTNPTGITVRTTRKTWESWLLTSFPEKDFKIVLSQGHTQVTSLDAYMNLHFLEDERAAIKAEVAGWRRLYE